MSLVKSFLSKLKKRYLFFKRSKYFEKIEVLLKDNPSIISNNCFAGRIYQDFNMQYSSPTVGLYMFYPDYIVFLKDIRNNLKADIVFVNNSKYPLGQDRIDKAKHKYPIGILNGNIEIHFLHYKTEEEAYRKWKARASRVDFDNLIVFGGEMDLCKPGDVKDFFDLDFESKYFFSANPYNYENCFFIKKFQNANAIGDPYRYGDIFYKALSQKNIK